MKTPSKYASEAGAQDTTFVVNRKVIRTWTITQEQLELLVLKVQEDAYKRILDSFE